MPQRVRSVENIPEEAAQLAEVASRLIESDPRNRRAFAELAALLAAADRLETTLAARSSMPVLVATVAKVLERRQARPTMALPGAERQLWEDAGASFDEDAVDLDVVNAAAAFLALVLRSVEGDGTVATLLRVDRSRISQRVRDRSLYAFTLGETRYFPRWQFDDSRTLPGLREILGSIDPRLHPLVIDHWFTTPSLDLEIRDVPASPVTWLATGGDPSVVAELASDL